MKIVFFGTPHFASEILRFLLNHNQQIVAVVTRPDRPKGRNQKLTPSAVKVLTQEKRPKIPIFQPEKASAEPFVSSIKKYNPDLFIVAAYGEIIKTNLLEVPKKGCINVHPSILPKYRGATPIQKALMNGDQETGVSIMEMILKMDAGDIYKIVKTPISEEMTFGELEEKLIELSGPALLEVIDQIEKGTAKKIPQNEEEATYVSKITLEDRKINWSKTATEIHNQIRGLSPFPGAFCFVEIGNQVKRLIIKKSRILHDKNGTPGATLSYDKNGWVIACGEGALSLIEIQLEGKKVLSITNFISGMQDCPKIKS